MNKRIIYYNFRDLFFDVYRLIHPKKKNFFGAHQSNNQLLLVGTGPSSAGDIPFKDYDVILLSNAYHRVHDYNKSNKVIGVAVCPYHEPIEKVNYRKWVENIFETVPDNCNVYFSFDDRVLNHLHVYKNARPISFLKSPLFRYNMRWSFPPLPYSSLVFGLYLGIQNRYKFISIYGCESNTLRFYKKNILHASYVKDDIRGNASDAGAWRGGLISHLKNEIKYHRQLCGLKKVTSDRKIIIQDFSGNDSWLEEFTDE